jgi:hypothetical protein
MRDVAPQRDQIGADVGGGASNSVGHRKLLFDWPATRNGSRLASNFVSGFRVYIRPIGSRTITMIRRRPMPPLG